MQKCAKNHNEKKAVTLRYDASKTKIYVQKKFTYKGIGFTCRAFSLKIIKLLRKIKEGQISGKDSYIDI